MTNAIGLDEAERRRRRRDQHAQDFFGGVRDRRQRIGRQHREAGDPREPFVMREMRRDRLADDEPLDLREEAFFGHDDLPTAGGVS